MNNYILISIAIIIIGLGIYFDLDYQNRIFLNTNLFVPIYITRYGFASGVYYPLIPYLGVYILGFIFGNSYFNIKKNPKSTVIYKYNIFTYFGKNTLIWYFLPQLIIVIFLAVFTLVNLLFI